MAGFQGNQYIDNGGHTNTFITAHDEMRYGPRDQNQAGHIILYDQTRAVGQHIETRPIQEGAHFMYGQAHFVPDPTDQDGMASIALNNDLQEGNGAQSASPQPAVIECPSCSPHSEGDTFLTTSATPAHDCGPNMQSVSGFSDYRMNIPSGGHLRELPLDRGDIFPPYLQNGENWETQWRLQPRPKVCDTEEKYERTTNAPGPRNYEETRVYAARNYVTAQQPATREIVQLPAQLNSQLPTQLNSQLPAQLNSQLAAQLTGPSEFEESGSHVASNFITAEQPTTRHLPHIPAQQQGVEHIPWPQYGQQHARVQSFRGWPQWSSQRPEVLAKAGFIYTGKSDICCCFHCGVQMREWEPDDDPVHEHIRCSPTCPFIREVERNGGETAVKTPDVALEQRMQDLCIGRQEKMKILLDMGFRKEDILLVTKKTGWKVDIKNIVDILLKQSSGSDCNNRRTETPREMDPSLCCVCKRRPVCVTLIPCSHIVCAQCARERDLDGYYWCGVCSKKVTENTAFDSNIFFK